MAPPGDYLTDTDLDPASARIHLDTGPQGPQACTTLLQDQT